ncbi:hypothetical protein AXG93_4027s1310 [Marchantia polymorpha subsp. ruderalis]|uniref:Retrotransposon Copia-like N-terminal domain-containing protein n=1 Tax=Marchantia polymorpha subsp. ruderalis TaxID=1480154 RepID=A0A176W5Z1_MARPO|nr:hypothetical protein AXG93_4027s1310 [Marchantia polymorpha subsp. ruderalis]
MDFWREAKDFDPTKKLDGINNYAGWAAQMPTILCKKKCYAAVYRSNALLLLLPAFEIPKILSDHASKNAITAKQEREAANEEIQEKIDMIFEQCDDAVYYIMMNVHKHIVHHISAMYDTHVLWKELETLFASASEDRRQLLRRKLSTLSMREGQSIETHMLVVRNLTNQLSNCKDTIKDSELIPLILMRKDLTTRIALHSLLLQA